MKYASIGQYRYFASKLIEKLYVKKLILRLEQKRIIPDHQVGYRDKYSTTEQVHRPTN